MQISKLFYFSLLCLIASYSDILANQVKSKSDKIVLGYHPAWVNDSAIIKYDWRVLDIAVYYGFEVNPYNGAAYSTYHWQETSLIEVAHAHNSKVQLLAALSGEDNTILLSNYSVCDTLIENLISFVQSRNADGISIDFEAIPTEQKANFVRFLSNLRIRMNDILGDSSLLTVAGPALDWRESWDFPAISDIVDYIILMGYDYHYSSSEEAGAVAPMGDSYWNVVSSTEEYLKQKVDKVKLLLGVPWYGYDWLVESEEWGVKTLAKAKSYQYAGAKKLANKYGSALDSATKSIKVRYQDDTLAWHQLWFDDSLSLSYKYDLVNDKEIAGIGIWAIGYEGDSPEMWQAITNKFHKSSFVHELYTELNSHIRQLTENIYAIESTNQIMDVKIVDNLGRAAISVNQSIEGKIATIDLSEVHGLLVIQLSYENGKNEFLKIMKM